MQTPTLELRRLKDRFIQILLSPLFDTSAEHHQQEFLRDAAIKLGMEPLQFNGFLRQVWNKSTPAPQIPESPSPQQSPTQIPSLPVPTTTPVLQTPAPFVFTTRTAPPLIQASVMASPLTQPPSFVQSIPISRTQPPVVLPPLLQPPPPFNASPLNAPPIKILPFQPELIGRTQPPPLVTQEDTPLSPTGYRKSSPLQPSGSTMITAPPVIRQGPSTIAEWKDLLVKIINGDIFSSVPVYQRLEYLLREYNHGLNLGAIRNATDFNQILVQNWRSNAPEIPQLSGSLQYSTVKNIYYKPTAPARTDVTYVGDKEFINLGRVRDQVFAFAKTVQNRLEQERKRQEVDTGSARGWPFELELMTLIDDINLVVREIWYREGQYFSTTIPLIEYVSTMQNWTDRYNAIVKELGKRNCINTHDPFDGTPVDEIPDGEYIRLANGICWHILSLTEYIRGATKGRNTSTGLSGYPTSTLWDARIDLPRILRHPLVRGTDFKKWFEERLTPKAIAAYISLETLARMERAGGLLRSVGPDFDREVRRRLTPAQHDVFTIQARGDPEALNRIYDPKLQEEIRIVIKQDIKSLAMIEWVEYWRTLTQEERDAILVFNSKLEENVSKCLIDQFCVFGMGNDFLFTRNEIALSKGIPVKNYGVSFE